MEEDTDVVVKLTDDEPTDSVEDTEDTDEVTVPEDESVERVNDLGNELSVGLVMDDAIPELFQYMLDDHTKDELEINVGYILEDEDELYIWFIRLSIKEEEEAAAVDCTNDEVARRDDDASDSILDRWEPDTVTEYDWMLDSLVLVGEEVSETLLENPTCEEDRLKLDRVDDAINPFETKDDNRPELSNKPPEPY